MRIGIPREADTGQTLVAGTPASVTKLIKLGYDVVVEQGAGDIADFPDHQYEAAGATIGSADDVWSSDIVTALDRPAPDRLDAMHDDAVLIARLNVRLDESIVPELHDRKLVGLSMDAVPRISRAQSMDVLSSMANVAGYRAVVEAASAFGRLFTGQVTAAGKMPPAHIYVIGAGVAGLSAIGTANAMGAVVKATDVRPEVAEQIESMGAEFVALPTAQEKSSDGYAKALDEDQEKVAQELYASVAKDSDIVITTAQIPGRPAPLLLTAEAVEAMKPGSVIVDMAGGNCELTKPGEQFVTDNGVTIIGYTDLAGRLPAQASQLYAQNLVHLLTLMTPEKDGELAFDLDDDVVRGITLTKGDDILWPPPPIQVSAAPSVPTTSEPTVVVEEHHGVAWSTIGLVVGFIIALAIIFASPTMMLTNYVVLALAVVLGFYVIGNVTPTLHTPLMSFTNALSGIVVTGAITQLATSETTLPKIIAWIAIVVASFNVIGGFAVTDRMLDMFKKD
ncbi:Re/Si-specific NAD(P)(+) transhydrogenase subunit alpha [Stomatohabitans albus]|uniref:Re/Si-specific NAD(P)(+) transhydrogenase subunit alpha n=1 Tax=Stomatohabitans albus TaxID=3110766 RepID=UPI00300C6997